MSNLSIAAILAAGHKKLSETQRAEEGSKVGTLRAGNAGAFVAGEIYGKCHRLSLLRYLGVQAEADTNRALMFQAGRTNEDSWIEVLKAGWDGPILQEEEIPVSWETKAGTKVTGRPDIVLCKEEPDSFIVDQAFRDSFSEMDPHRPNIGDVIEALPKKVPVKGLELKLVSSFWTMITVLTAKEPKVEHVIQAIHYSSQLGIPFELWYTSRVDWAISGWTNKFFTAAAKWVASALGYNPVLFGKKGPKKVMPFYQGFELDVDADLVYYRPVGTEGWIATTITVQGIRDYYELIDDMRINQHTGPRPSGKKLDGRWQEGWHPCDPEYCPFSATCDKWEKDYPNWVAEAKKIT